MHSLHRAIFNRQLTKISGKVHCRTNIPERSKVVRKYSSLIVHHIPMLCIYVLIYYKWRIQHLRRRFVILRLHVHTRRDVIRRVLQRIFPRFSASQRRTTVVVLKGKALATNGAYTCDVTPFQQRRAARASESLDTPVESVIQPLRWVARMQIQRDNKSPPFDSFNHDNTIMRCTDVVTSIVSYCYGVV